MLLGEGSWASGLGSAKGRMSQSFKEKEEETAVPLGRPYLPVGSGFLTQSGTQAVVSRPLPVLLIYDSGLVFKAEKIMRTHSTQTSAIPVIFKRFP